MQNDPPLGQWATFLRSVTLPLEKLPGWGMRGRIESWAPLACRSKQSTTVWGTRLESRGTRYCFLLRT